MFAYQTKTESGNDALNIMVDGYLPAQDGASPDVVITKQYSDVAGGEIIVIKVSGNAVVQGASIGGFTYPIDVNAQTPDAALQALQNAGLISGYTPQQ